jgi:hypothetical protein
VNADAQQVGVAGRITATELVQVTILKPPATVGATESTRVIATRGVLCVPDPCVPDAWLQKVPKKIPVGPVTDAGG